MANVDLAKYSKRLVQYFWDPIPRNDDPTGPSIWCLGRSYETCPIPAQIPQTLHDSARSSPPALSVSHSSEVSSTRTEETGSIIDSIETRPDDDALHDLELDGGWPSAFLDDFESRIWLTYRSNFPPIPKSPDPKATAAMSFAVRIRQLGSQEGFTSDTGWGCMIRSGQSLLANALLVLTLGRDWRRGTKVADERRILSMFSDDPRAPLSIHKFVEHGAAACGKHPGEWFGPSATARCIQALANQLGTSGIKVYMTGDGSDVYEDSFMNIAKSKGGTFQPTLVLVGIRLGIDRVTPVYWEGLKRSFQLPQSIGIAGGRPSSSHYFIGVQGSYFFYLDPHQTRPAFPLLKRVEDYTPQDIESCHTRRLRRLHITEMDPSMLIAFLIRTEDDWRDWKQSVSAMPGKSIIHIADHEPAFSGTGNERDSAIDEVEAFDDDEDELA